MRVVLIAGPTASGKSSAAIGVAQKLNGAIINADSMQVYDGLTVLTSRPSLEDEALVEHQMYGYLPAGQLCTVARWLEDVRVKMDDVWARGKVPIIVGGTGLYFKALEIGLSKVPEIPEGIRQELRERLVDEGPERLHKELSLLDGDEGARLNAGDGQRILRALEVIKATGKPLGEFHRLAAKHSALVDVEQVDKFALSPERSVLYGRINNRFKQMVDGGGLDEVKALRALNLSPDLPIMKAIGVRALGQYLDGATSLEAAIDGASQETRNYAKRQMTWQRNQMSDWTLVDSGSKLSLKKLTNMA